MNDTVITYNGFMYQVSESILPKYHFKIKVLTSSEHSKFERIGWIDLKFGFIYDTHSSIKEHDFCVQSATNAFKLNGDILKALLRESNLNPTATQKSA